MKQYIYSIIYITYLSLSASAVTSSTQAGQPNTTALMPGTRSLNIYTSKAATPAPRLCMYMYSVL